MTNPAPKMTNAEIKAELQLTFIDRARQEELQNERLRRRCKGEW